MSRVPQARSTVKTTLVPPSSRSRAPSPSKPSASSVATPSTPRVRTKSVPKSPSKSIRRAPPEVEVPVPKTPLNLKEAIALKRAETKKAATKQAVSGGIGFDNFDTLEDAIPGASPTKKEADENVDLGRWSIKEAIERARNTGAINLSSRSLPCLPSALFEIHLGMKPDALKSVLQEPPIGISEAPGKRPGQREGPAWFEAQDLQVLKAWNNEIVEIQHEISLFGSLKSIDLHQNNIRALPDTFADLTALTSLDLSHNSLTSVPINIFALPSLSILNLSHNALVALPFGEPFSGSFRRSRTDTYSAGGFFGPVIIRANEPLPRLLTLDVSFNKLNASTMDHKNLPVGLSKIDLSSNPIASDNSDSSALIRALAGLSQLKELRLAHADIGDDAFPAALLADVSRSFSSLRVLDLEETRVNVEAVTLALSGLKQSIVFDVTADGAREDTLRITVGKKDLREAWEIEAERRARHRSGKSLADAGPTSGTADPPSREAPAKEAWEIEAEQGLLTEGGRRRARAAAAAESSPTSASAPSTDGKRCLVFGIGHPSSSPPQGVPLASFNLSTPEYYDAATQTLTLPPSAPPMRSHARSFSLATSPLNVRAAQGKTDIALPTPSLPITALCPQSFAQSLKILILSNRKLDLSVALPSESDAGVIPTLEELVMDGCGFGDNVTVTRQVEGSPSPIKSSQPLLPLLTRLFPNLRTLDVSYNALTSAALQKDVLIALIMFQDGASRAGLRHLRLQGNRITTLDGFQGMAEIFKGHRSVPDWKLEELDLRDNEIAKLPPELGLLPLDVLLVDGNVFRIPQRRIWEREGTRGLLSWLRGRIE